MHHVTRHIRCLQLYLTVNRRNITTWNRLSCTPDIALWLTTLLAFVIRSQSVMLFKHLAEVMSFVYFHFFMLRTNLPQSGNNGNVLSRTPLTSSLHCTWVVLHYANVSYNTLATIAYEKLQYVRYLTPYLYKYGEY
jgi:hypothetical protein